jgi:hypothetical protein
LIVPYRSLADPKRAGGPVTVAYCWAHCRRQFFDIADHRSTSRMRYHRSF